MACVPTFLPKVSLLLNNPNALNAARLLKVAKFSGYCPKHTGAYDTFGMFLVACMYLLNLIRA